MWILDYYEKEQKIQKEKGKKYLLKDMSHTLGCTREYLSRILSGAKIISTKMADKFEHRTCGVLEADTLIEKSIEKHRKYLDRKEKFGNLLKIAKS